jgi:glutamate/tyrosine decarboxylase-like PLP-dependent enzyme
VAPAQLNIVCFRYRADDSNAINAEIVADLHESGIAAPSTTTINGQLTIRAAFVNHRTQPCDVDALVESVLRFGAARAGVHRHNSESATVRDTGSKTKRKLPAQYIPDNLQTSVEPEIAA